MKIIVITKSKIKDIPPVISVAHILSELGHSVNVITSEVNPKTAEGFNKKGIEYTVFPYANASHPFKKMYEYIMFRKKVLDYLRLADFDLLWIEGAHTLLSLGEGIKQYKYILQISELHENSKTQLKAIGNVIHDAYAVFMPEYNRAAIYRAWFKLKKMPFILPNKPQYICNDEELKIYQSTHAERIKVFEEKKVILYQGYLGRDRDLTPFVKAVKELGEDYRFVIMGEHRKMVDTYKEIDPNLIHIGFTPAPEHLAYTSKAFIGVLSYDPIILNNAFCAPNKIFEYTNFGVPILCNELPGLKSMLDSYKAGISVDITDIEAIKKCILEISQNYNEYQNNAIKLYKSVDNLNTIRTVLDKI